MDIKLIDGLKLLECHKVLADMFLFIVIVCSICALLFGCMMISNLGKKMILAIVYAVCTFTFVMITIFICTCDKCNIAECQVIIEDEQKCTYQDIVNNYKVTNQDGLIYTIKLLGDNE